MRFQVDVHRYSKSSAYKSSERYILTPTSRKWPRVINCAVFTLTSASKFNIEPNGGAFDTSPKTTARHPTRFRLARETFMVQWMRTLFLSLLPWLGWLCCWGKKHLHIRQAASCQYNCGIPRCFPSHLPWHCRENSAYRVYIRQIRRACTQMTRCQNIDVTPGTDWNNYLPSLLGVMLNLTPTQHQEFEGSVKSSDAALPVWKPSIVLRRLSLWTWTNEDNMNLKTQIGLRLRYDSEFVCFFLLFADRIDRGFGCLNFWGGERAHDSAILFPDWLSRAGFVDTLDWLIPLIKHRISESRCLRTRPRPYYFSDVLRMY